MRELSKFKNYRMSIYKKLKENTKKICLMTYNLNELISLIHKDLKNLWVQILKSQ